MLLLIYLSADVHLSNLSFTDFLLSSTYKRQELVIVQIIVEGNLAFGGRGSGVRWKKQSKNPLDKFNSTLGFPGEGWKFKFLSVTTWNTRSLTQERFSYCKNLGYDVLAITDYRIMAIAEQISEQEQSLHYSRANLSGKWPT